MSSHLGTLTLMHTWQSLTSMPRDLFMQMDRQNHSGRSLALMQKLGAFARTNWQPRKRCDIVNKVFDKTCFVEFLQPGRLLTCPLGHRHSLTQLERAVQPYANLPHWRKLVEPFAKAFEEASASPWLFALMHYPQPARLVPSYEHYDRTLDLPIQKRPNVQRCPWSRLLTATTARHPTQRLTDGLNTSWLWRADNALNLTPNEPYGSTTCAAYDTTASTCIGTSSHPWLI